MLLRELKEMVESTADAAFAVDSAGIIVAWNGPAEELFGVPANAAVGQPLKSLTFDSVIRSLSTNFL